MKGITKAQKECLEAVADFIGKNGFSPTYSELGKALKQSPVAVYNKVNALCRKGYLTKTYCGHRSILVREKALGQITADELKLTIDDGAVVLSEATALTIRHFTRVLRYDTVGLSHLLSVDESVVWNALCLTDHTDGRAAA